MAQETMCGKNSSHTLAYSIVGLQEANLAYHYPIIYWNTANLISDSGGEDGSTNYEKIAVAVSSFQKQGIKVTLPDINKSDLFFTPDVENNQIIYGLKPIQGIGGKVAKAIIDNRPYSSMDDFYNKMQIFKNAEVEEGEDKNKFGDTAMIVLIKAGCFDALENRPRVELMKEFIKKLSKPISNLKIGHIEDLASLGLLTNDQRKYELRLFRFRKYLFDKKFFVEQTGKSASTAFYRLDHKFAEPYFYENFEANLTEGKDYKFTSDGFIAVKKGSIDKVFDKLVENFKVNVLTNSYLLDQVNQKRFLKTWSEKIEGDLSKWEMDSLCIYYHDHELKNVNKTLYNIVDFADLPEEPEIVDKYFYRGQKKARYRLTRICGTVLGRNKDKHLVYLLTLNGVVNVKFYKGQFNFYDKQISELNVNGNGKTVLEKSWFSRGSKLLITGFRREEQFIPKKYSDSIYKHSIQLIKDLKDDGTLILQSERQDIGTGEGN